MDWGGVRELAAHYVQLIMKQQPHGPYFLGGYSYGGLLAYEMASLLTERNQRVEFVAMIDTFPWHPQSRTIAARMASMQEDGNTSHRHVQVCERSLVLRKTPSCGIGSNFRITASLPFTDKFKEFLKP